ncbi:MarR family transcriptional regulator [Rhodococcus sp. Rp3]|uniref:MarR family transcriptional regulator n=1 Tax=Rhodococcus sp. Rp3 TaxID=2807635 RepID=UPI00233F3FEF|nr:MarR family transcriptional regulator [Rhodococcus sp. Rp3]
MTADTCYLLDLIVQHDGIAMNDLARRLAIPAPTLTKLVDRLASKALVFRLVDHTDRRRTLVHASLRGSEVHATASQRAREIEARFMAELGWSDAQLNALQALNAPEDH